MPVRRYGYPPCRAYWNTSYDEIIGMRLPNAEGAQVDPKKLKEYLLSESHPVGRSKAKFFHGMGFDESNFDVLGEGLIGIAQTEEIVEAEPSPHGTIYIVDGFITTPPWEPDQTANGVDR